jgi:hypothetical protein
MPKQNELEGMESPRIKAIDQAADDYVTVRDKRMKLTEQEVACKHALIEVCKKNEDKLSSDGNGTLRYRYDDLVVEWSKCDKIRVKHSDTDDLENEED